MTIPAVQLDLDSWQFKARDPAKALADDFATPDGWQPASAPGTVHQALLDAGAIPDPFVGLNERDVQWVGGLDWLYRSVFDWLAGPEQTAWDLCLDGLDTYAQVWLNGTLVLSSDNMFQAHRLSVGHLLRPGPNQLHLLFESAERRGRALEAEHGVLAAWNTESSRVYVRKAQFHYGWDWGPRLVTAGPWRAVRLEGYGLRFDGVQVRPELSADLSHASLRVSAALFGPAAGPPLHLRAELVGPDGRLVAAQEQTVQGGPFQLVFELPQPALWWPRGQGGQPLYTLHLAVSDGHTAQAQTQQRFGIRRLRLVQDPQPEGGRSFVFEVNGREVFCGGANWIPADVLTPRVDPARYDAWLGLAAEAHLTMLRVWGGGIYEDDHFYDRCDELGLLVWQDFMFACGLYPAHDGFARSVEHEARAAVRRLRHHPSLAVWCGNNEDYQLAYALGRYDAALPWPAQQDEFPARRLYEQVLAEVCAELDGERPYLPGSPYGGADPDDPSQGDRHVWAVWGERLAPYQSYPELGGRFVSEFGMQAMTTPEDMVRFAGRPGEAPTHEELEHRNKCPGGNARLAHYTAPLLPAAVPAPAGLEQQAYLTQLMQAEALGLAMRAWRTDWGRPQARRCGGALVWQLNDCWPVTGWSLADSQARPKMAYYAVKRALAPLALHLTRSGGGLRLNVMNSRPADLDAQLEWTAWSAEGEMIQQVSQPLRVAGNSAFGLDAPLTWTGLTVARLVVNGAQHAQAFAWPEPLGDYAWVDPELSVTPLGDDRLRLSVRRPAKGVWLRAGTRVTWSDNGLDLVPGPPTELSAAGLGDAEVTATTLYDLARLAWPARR